MNLLYGFWHTHQYPFKTLGRVHEKTIPLFTWLNLKFLKLHCLFWISLVSLNRPLNIKAFLADTLIATQVKDWLKTADFLFTTICCKSATLYWQDSIQFTGHRMKYLLFFLPAFKTPVQSGFSRYFYYWHTLAFPPVLVQAPVIGWSGKTMANFFSLGDETSRYKAEGW